MHQLSLVCSLHVVSLRLCVGGCHHRCVRDTTDILRPMDDISREGGLRSLALPNIVLDLDWCLIVFRLRYEYDYPTRGLMAEVKDREEEMKSGKIR
jgi:hypothetical protein